MAHLNAIHGPSLLAGGALSAQGVLGGGMWARHFWTASWAAVAEAGETHRAQLELHHQLRLFGKFALISMNVTANQVSIFFSSLILVWKVETQSLELFLCLSGVIL